VTPQELLKTIYLGDRSCKAILIDGWAKSVAVQVDVISRIRSSSGNWEFYADEDIPDGRLVFTGVRSIRWAPVGPVPNDLINEVRVADFHELQSGTRLYDFSLYIGSVTDSGESQEVTLQIRAEGLHLEDPGRPGEVVL
jgi:uncharacterized protein DUF6258